MRMAGHMITSPPNNNEIYLKNDSNKKVSRSVLDRNSAKWRWTG